MQIAITLLMSAMQLLALVNGNPSLPQSFRDNAVIIANKAIAVAQDEIANANKTAEQPVILPVVQPVAPLPFNQPTYGSIQPMEDKSEIVVTLVSTSKPDAINSMPFGEYGYNVAVLNSEGKNIEMAEITFVGEDNVYPQKTRKADSISATGMKDWTGTFSYAPTSKGMKTLTFTSGTLTKTLTLDVQ